MRKVRKKKRKREGHKKKKDEKWKNTFRENA